MFRRLSEICRLLSLASHREPRFTAAARRSTKQAHPAGTASKTRLTHPVKHICGWPSNRRTRLREVQTYMFAHTRTRVSAPTCAQTREGKGRAHTHTTRTHTHTRTLAWISAHTHVRDRVRILVFLFERNHSTSSTEQRSDPEPT